jgi:hypothetical protein
MFLAYADAKGARLDGLTFHSYPLGGELSQKVMNPAALAGLSRATDCYLDAGRNHSKTLRLAMTETNSNAATAANLGQNRFANGLWYVSSLGASAMNGMQLHARWKLWDPRVAYRANALNQTFGFLNKEFDKVRLTFVAVLWLFCRSLPPFFWTGDTRLLGIHAAQATDR